MAERTGFLYPFLDDAVDDPESLLADLRSSATAKWEESVELRRTTLAELTGTISATAAAIAGRLAAGGRLLAFGNGGSAADAEAFAHRCASVQPRALPALSLVGDPAVLTALANDIGAEAVFARQLEALARPDDVAIALSTSGGSTNLLAAVDRCRTMGVLTVGFAGYGGGALGERVDHALVVRSQSVHRIQEVQTAISSELVAAISRAVTGGAP